MKRIIMILMFGLFFACSANPEPEEFETQEPQQEIDLADSDRLTRGYEIDPEDGCGEGRHEWSTSGKFLITCRICGESFEDEADDEEDPDDPDDPEEPDGPDDPGFFDYPDFIMMVDGKVSHHNYDLNGGTQQVGVECENYNHKKIITLRTQLPLNCTSEWVTNAQGNRVYWVMNSSAINVCLKFESYEQGHFNEVNFYTYDIEIDLSENNSGEMRRYNLNFDFFTSDKKRIASSLTLTVYQN